jgi:hypothetical protein
MAHFAELNDQNEVLRVIVVDNADCLNAEGQEDEAVGIAFCQNLLGGNWIQTSYNTRGGVHYGQDGEPDGGVALRKNYAGIGYSYDPVLDAFIPPKPFDSWVINETTGLWDAPVPRPDDGQIYMWNEDTANWVLFTEPTV